MILYELRKQTSRYGDVKLVTEQELTSNVGFRSVFGFTDSAIAHIRETRSTRGLKGFELYSDTLFVDFDDQPEAAGKFEHYLRDTIYYKYDSGGRSIHFHVPIKPMLGPLVPESHKAFMRSVSPLADMSLYKTSGMYRLEGTFHSKNRGRYKKLISSNERGMPLEIPMIEQSLKDPEELLEGQSIESEKDLEYILMRLLVTPVSEGTKGRNNVIFQIACLCKDLGKDSKECEKLCFNWNRNYSKPPLQPIGILSTIQSAYQR